MAQRKPISRRIALAFPPTRLPHVHLILSGILDYVRNNANWVFINSGAIFEFPVTSISNWQSDGIIAVINTSAAAAAAQKLKTPIVTISATLRNIDIPCVTVDPIAVGELAADHLFTCGYRNFAYFGVENAAYSEDRQTAFVKALKARGFIPRIRLSGKNLGERQSSWSSDLRELSNWLASRRAPLGIYAATDSRARMLADACAISGKRIPQEVGIIGTDNDELICEFGSPTLTSIARDWHAMGFETAALLDRLMDGAKLATRNKLIQPIGVVARESTSTVLSNHPDVAKAIAYVNANATASFGVDALVAAVGVSRRHLELAFRKSLHCSPMTFLSRFRIERAKSMLQQREPSLTTIARACGFTDLRQFRRTFQKLTRMMPRHYRGSFSAIRRK
jgi:LacI family transcriptional regulator